MSNECWIQIQDFKVFLHIGAFKEEKTLGQNLIVALSLLMPEFKDSDKLEDTLDYGKLILALNAYFESLPKLNLLESLALQTIGFIQAKYPQVRGVVLKITKPAPPIPHFSGQVGVEVKKLF